MRPNKSGHWWYERKDREEPEIWSVFREKPEDVAWKAFDFEGHPNFKRWLGPVNPYITRESVSWFAQQMELKLKENDHKGGWNKCTNESLFKRLQEETEELKMAMQNRFSPFGKNIKHEAADVANFCMMIADNLRNQESED